MPLFPVVAACLTALPPSRLTAQCPDGAPPPCRRASSSAPRVRPAPPLDDRTWIIVPFENVARAPDIDWLKDASVNLLYLDMSKWQDIHVIDDERVADFMREVPELRSGQSLTLQSGMAVARRAGAGKLVMGDLLKVGSRTQVVAKVFDVRSGQRIRTVRQDAPVADSIMGVFGRLARAVLNVEPPAGTNLGTIGTTSVGAYQAYIAGVGFLNRWLLDSAQSRFSAALALDSSFALAHYKLAVVFGWHSANDREGPRHADLAVRLGTNLPTRERNLVAGYAAFANGRHGEACDIFTRMLRTDSMDVEAWYNLGECSYHDNAVIPVEGDSTQYRFRSSWNTMLRAFRRTLELDPSYHLAFQHIQDALLSAFRAGCQLTPGTTQCAPNQAGFQAALQRSGDSLLTIPANMLTEPQGFMNQSREAIRQGARRQNIEDARRAAEAWLDAGPTEARPRVAYARILLRLGLVERADSVARLVGGGSLSRAEAGNFSTDRVEIAVKLGRFADAARITDSIRTATDSLPGARNLGIIMQLIMGHTADFAPLVESSVQGPPWVKSYFHSQALVFLGLPADSVLDQEAVLSRNIAPSQGAARVAMLTLATTGYLDPGTRGGRWPVLDSASADPRVALMSMIATGDTARMRAAVARYDALLATTHDEPDAGLTIPGVYAHLAIGDSAGALQLLRTFRDVLWPHSPMFDQVGAGFTFQGMLWPRTFLMLGDLAAAAGQREEAVNAYRIVVGMWQGGDAGVQPMVRHARDAVARLGR